MKDDTIQLRDKDTYEGNGGVKMRVSWGIVERALKADGALGRSEYIKNVQADEHGVVLTLGRHKG